MVFYLGQSQAITHVRSIPTDIGDTPISSVRKPTHSPGSQNERWARSETHQNPVVPSTSDLESVRSWPFKQPGENTNKTCVLLFGYNAGLIIMTGINTDKIVNGSGPSLRALGFSNLIFITHRASRAGHSLGFSILRGCPPEHLSGPPWKRTCHSWHP